MAYCENLAGRIRDYFASRNDVKEIKMFGGLAFMVAGHMCVGVKNEWLMARTGPDLHDEALKRPGAKMMDFTGKSLKGFVYVGREMLEEDDKLKQWIRECEGYVFSLPPK